MRKLLRGKGVFSYIYEISENNLTLGWSAETAQQWVEPATDISQAAPKMTKPGAEINMVGKA